MSSCLQDVLPKINYVNWSIPYTGISFLIQEICVNVSPSLFSVHFYSLHTFTENQRLCLFFAFLFKQDNLKFSTRDMLYIIHMINYYHKLIIH
jgi:hypothetical protein